MDSCTIAALENHRPPPTSDPQSHRVAWDAFIDDLDRAGQAGTPAAVEVPAIAGPLTSGKRFGDLTRSEIQDLSRIAASLGRRADVVVTMWRDLQWKLKQQKKASRLEKKPGGGKGRAP